MTTNKQIELIDELADKCCKDHDIHKSCMACWRRTQGCGKFITLNKLVEEGCKIERKGEWKPYTEYYADDYSECNTRKVWTCSLCGRIEKYQQPYCHCGAKMGLKEIEE